jgi:DNA-binding CsgD family transcriptional regulator/tetratricopeptide (TPR) repeat protein
MTPTPEEPAPHPLVGRDEELQTIRDALHGVAQGKNAAVVLAGEAGIGKTRLIAEVTATATESRATVLTGHCTQEWATPYGPLVEALTTYVESADPAQLRADLGFGAAPLARLVPAIRDRLPETPEPEALRPDEERFRLFDAISQFLIALSARSTVLFVIDDLHWADEGTLAMLRHIARATRDFPLLLLAAYRDTDVDDSDAVARTLKALRLETTLHPVSLGGLDTLAANELLRQVTDADLESDLVDTIRKETDGNPFFITEMASHLTESGLLRREASGGLVITTTSIADLGFPTTVREAVQNRLQALSPETRSLLAAASAFGGSFPLAIAAASSDVSEEAALSAVDEALAARMIRPEPTPDRYDFTHALVRYAIYDGMNPSRRARLHRRVAEEIENAYGERASDHAEMLTYQYQQSASLPGAEHGADYALAGANRARHVYAWPAAARLYRAALDLMAEDDPRITQATADLGRCLIFSGHPENAEPVIAAAADLIARGHGPQAAARYLADMVIHLASVGSPIGPARLALRGLEYSGDTRDAAWALMQITALNRRDAEDPDFPGIDLETPERLELSDVIRHNISGWERAIMSYIIFFDSRADLQAFLDETGTQTPALRAGHYRTAIPFWERECARHFRNGSVGMAATNYAQLSRLRSAVGDFAEATEAFTTARNLSLRLPLNSNPIGSLAEARLQRTFARGEGWERLAATSDMFRVAVPQRARAATFASNAQVYAEIGRFEDALEMIAQCMPAIQQGSGRAEYYMLVALSVVEALWILGRTDHIKEIEDNVRRKIIELDFRYTMRDGRRSMGHICALQGRHDEARDWFARARISTEEDHQRPLRALVDFDEALMWLRRGRRGDRERANPLLQAAIEQFQAIDMIGWEKRARDLTGSTRPAFPDKLTGREVEVLRLIAAGRTNKQISDDLVLSPRTVARHITNIYAKIGAENKAEATSYAIRHGLMNE